jgi:hypothetical protein
MCVCVTSKHRLSRLSCYSNVHTPSNFPLLLVTSLSPPPFSTLTTHVTTSTFCDCVVTSNLIRLKTRRERSVRGRPRSVRALTGSPVHDEAKAESAIIKGPRGFRPDGIGVRRTTEDPVSTPPPGAGLRLAYGITGSHSCSVYLAAVYETAPWGTNSVLLRNHVVPYLETSRHRACAQRAFTLAL